MLDRAFFIALVLNTSGLFRFVAPHVGVEIGDVTLALLALNALYILARASLARDILLHSAMGRWLILFLVWPFATITYAPTFELREAGLSLYFFSLFFGTVVYTRVNGLQAMYRMLTMSVVITLIGMPLSVAAPQYFEDVAALAGANAVEMGRPIGFFMQPNRLAVCLAWIFMAWYALYPKKTVAREVIIVLGFLGLELATGSRSGVLVSVGIVGVLLAHNWPQRLLRGRLLLTGLLLLLCVAAGAAGLRVYLDSLSDAAGRRHGDLVDRMESMVTLEFSPEGSLESDTSLKHRFATQAEYVSNILERPLLGHGFGSNVHYLKTGEIALSAHSEALSRAFDYGVLYPIAMWVAVGSLFLRRGRRKVEQALGSNSVAQFACGYAVIFAYASVMEEGRAFCIVLALFYALVEFPEQLFQRDDVTGKLGRPFGRHEVRMQLRRGPASPSKSQPESSLHENEECAT